MIDILIILLVYKEIVFNFDCVIVEGVGGLMVLVNDELDMVDFVEWLKLFLVVVVCVGLGMINYIGLMLYYVC